MELNQELYMLKLMNLTPKELAQEEATCIKQRAYYLSPKVNEPIIAKVFIERLQVINKYRQTLKLLEIY